MDGDTEQWRLYRRLTECSSSFISRLLENFGFIEGGGAGGLLKSCMAVDVWP